MKSFFHFLQYNNAVPITFGILFLGAGGAFAAANPEVILDTQQHVISIDNTYIANKNLNAFTPKVKVTSVKEDDEYYYVAYVFSTIDLMDSVWQNVDKDLVLKVSKIDLGQYRDLGLYVMEQLQQKIEYEISYLKEVQGFEKRNITQKATVTEYKGLVGALLTDKTEVAKGYVPIVEEKLAVETWQRPFQEPEKEPVVVEVTEERDVEELVTVEEVVENVAEEIAPEIPTLAGPEIQILGDNPTRVLLGTPYIDLGAVAYDSGNNVTAITVFLNNIEVDRIEVDTLVLGEYSITYRATDSNGLASEATRNVIVYEDAPLSGGDDGQTPASSTDTATPISGGEEVPATDSTADVGTSSDTIITEPVQETFPETTVTEPTPTPMEEQQPISNESPSPAQGEESSVSSDGTVIEAAEGV